MTSRQQSEEVERNGSEDEDEEKPGKRVMGPRKKFIWEDKLRYQPPIGGHEPSQAINTAF